VSGCKVLRPALLEVLPFLLDFSFFKMICVLTYLSFFLIYHKKQLRGIFVKNKD